MLSFLTCSKEIPTGQFHQAVPVHFDGQIRQFCGLEKRLEEPKNESLLTSLVNILHGLLHVWKDVLGLLLVLQQSIRFLEDADLRYLKVEKLLWCYQRGLNLQCRRFLRYSRSLILLLCFFFCRGLLLLHLRKKITWYSLGFSLTALFMNALKNSVFLDFLVPLNRKSGFFLL